VEEPDIVHEKGLVLFPLSARDPGQVREGLALLALRGAFRSFWVLFQQALVFVGVLLVAEVVLSRLRYRLH
jgi:hypothetical protein